MARPSKYKPEFPETLRTEMAKGLSFEACCGLLGVSKDTGYEWLNRHPEFKDAKLEGEALGQLFWEKQALENLVTGAMEKFNSTVFIFTMKNRFGWRDKKEITGPGGGALLISNLTPGQVDGKIDEILRRLPRDFLERAAAPKGSKPK